MCPLVCGLGDGNKKQQAVLEECESRASGDLGDLNLFFLVISLYYLTALGEEQVILIL